MNAIASEVLSLKWLDAKIDLIGYFKKKYTKLCGIMDQELQGVSAWKIMIGMITVFVGLNTSIIGFIVVEQMDMKTKQAEISASRMSTEDGKGLLVAINQVKQEVASIPKENPPSWVLQLIKNNDVRVDKLEARLDAYQATLKK